MPVRGTGKMTRGREQNRSDVFAGRIKSLRAKSQYTQGELANKLEVSQSLISDCEGGQLPKPFVLIRIAKFFNVTLDYLLGVTDWEGAPLTKEEHLLLSAYYRGDTETVNKMIAQRLLQAIIDDPTLLEDMPDKREAIPNGE